MTRRKLYLACALIGLSLSSVAGAQGRDTLPIPKKAEDVMAAQGVRNADDVREKIRQSGLTPAQIRERLQQAGMSASALDSYLGGAAGATGAPVLPPTPDVLAAVSVLGIVDQAAQAAATMRPPRDTTQRDSVVTTIGGLPVFGLQLFKRGTNQFEPNAVGPVDANYRIGPLDVVAVILTGETELSHSLEVTRDGFIVIPQVGQVFVANLTLAQATQVIVQKLRVAYAGAGTGANASTKVYVTIARLRTNQIFVIGEVNSPGSYQVSAAGTVLTALYASGGPTINGTLRSIEVRRGGVVVSSIDLYDYLLRGDASRDIRLESGDIIFVGPSNKHVSIQGEILRPAVYELKTGETLADLTRYAGGLKSTAATARVQINRILPPAERQLGGRDRTVIDVLGDPMDPTALASRTPLAAADEVTVFKVTERVRNELNIRGNVWSPGTLALRPSMTLSDAFRVAGGLRPDTYTGEVQVTRQLPNDRREQVAVPLDSAGRPLTEFLLREGDSIRVFSNLEFRTERTVVIAGAVRKMMETPWREGITLRDLVQLGGGVESEADVLDSASISRLQPDLTRRVLAVPLYERSGQFSANRLEAGDQVMLFSRTQFRPQRYVRVGGAVHHPLDLPYVEGLTLRQALLAAGGPDESALLTGVQISRLPERLQAGKLADVITVALDSTYVFERGANGKYLGPQGVAVPSGGANEILLKPYDQVNVLRQPEWDFGGSVTLAGEVKFPGSYALLRRDETIREVIERAGGLTPRAYALGAIFSRPVSKTDITERKRLLERVRRDRVYGMAADRATPRVGVTTTGLSPADTSIPENRALADVFAAPDSGNERIAIDLARALRDARSRDNLVMRPGDSLHVPFLNPTVTVRGFVGSPSTVPYRPGASLRSYIDLAGGPTSNADMRRVIVQQPNGVAEPYVYHRLRPSESPTPLAGAVIVVPPQENRRDNTGWMQALTAFAGLATAAAAIISVSR
jgi:polysaccharide export outer membrane protein